MSVVRQIEARGQEGAALVITVLIMLLLSMLAFTSIRHSEQESAGGARSRSATRALYAADAGVQLALSRLSDTPANLNSFDIDLADNANVQSRTRTQGSPQALPQVGLGEPPDGGSVNIGSGVAFVNRIYQANVTASAATSTAELEAKLGRLEATAGGY